MTTKTKTQAPTKAPMNIDEKVSLARRAAAAFAKAKTAEDLRTAWNEHYLKLGHRVLGRLLLGKSVEFALRLNKEE
jgi:hypothetical protein